MMLGMFVTCVASLVFCAVLALSPRFASGVTLLLVAITCLFAARTVCEVSFERAKGRLLRHACAACLVMACFFGVLCLIEELEFLSPIAQWLSVRGMEAGETGESILSIASLCLSCVTAAAVSEGERGGR